MRVSVFEMSIYGCRIGGAVFDNTVTAGKLWWEDGMKYMVLLYGEPDAGVLVDSSPLQPPQAATTVRVRNGETQLSDGPFAEIKEQLGGYYILDCADLDIALRYAAMIPSAKYGSVEVRPLMVVGPH